WEAILPDPLSQLGKFLQGGFLDYRVEPPRFGLALEELFDAFREAEERLAMTEQSVISFEAPAGELSYLLHFSRHRLVGISRPPVVDDLARRFRESGLAPSDLAAALGSPATLLRVSIAPEAACPLG